MYLRKRAIAITTTALMVGCSGEVSSPEDGNGAKDDADAMDDERSFTDQQGDGSSEVVSEVVNDDGTTTITRDDGSTVTYDADGNVVAETPPTDDPASLDDGAEPDLDSDVGVDDGTSAGAAGCAPGTPESSQFLRLTNLQYDRTVADLIHVDLGLSQTTLAADSKGNMDARTWSGYASAAATIASTIINDPTARAAVVTCGSEDAECARQVISDFGARVFRRPLEASEAAAFEALYADTSLTENGTFDEQLQVALEAMFLSPFFLTLAEVNEETSVDEGGGERFALSDYELASRLSYMLWDTMPDEPLLDAANRGELRDGDGLANQAARMLGDDRAKGLVQRMHMDYLRMGANTRWADYVRDEAKYSHYSPTQRDAIAAETLRVAEAVVLGGGTFADLMTTTVGFVNADTAPLYGLNAADFGDELEETELGAGRPGILTRAGFLAANSYGNRTSPIHRGTFIMKDVLCTTIGNPSPDAAGTPLPEDEGLVTNRQKTAAQTSIRADCVACHESVVNPPGFALEGFDAVGGVQVLDNGEQVDTSADVLVGGQVVRVTGAEDLMQALAAAPAAGRCYTENWVQIAYNRVLSAEDVCTIDEIGAKMVDPNYAVTKLISDLASVENFRYRAHESEVAQ